ncbi:MAG: hypothetical protein JWQ94_2192, partial [Tardiphaga sp.]|nr:hypothetical protein [Tardiphaga sp.]
LHLADWFGGGNGRLGEMGEKGPTERAVPSFSDGHRFGSYRVRRKHGPDAPLSWRAF